MRNKYLIIFILLIASILRLFSLDKYPAGLNADEAALGYNAWSLIQTGKDEHSTPWPITFRSFDDYKPGVYVYLALPFVKVLGLSEWAVRLPSAILGIFSVYLVYLISKKLFSEQVGIVSSVILAVSPWHLHFSRGGWEVNAALFFILLGLWSFFKGTDNSKYYFLFVLSLAISLYTYHSARIISPLLALLLLILYWKDLKLTTLSRSSKTFFVACALGVVAALPLGIQMLSKEGQSRFTGVSVFSDSGPLWQALELRRGHEDTNIYVKLIHNQYLSYGLRFVKNYLSHYSPRFLFVTGDEIARSRVPEMGQSLYFLAPFYFIGLLSLLRLNSKGKIFIFIWYLIAPLAATLTFQSPHALRAQNMVIPLSVISGLGFVSVIESIKKSKFILYTFSVIFIAIGGYQVCRYLHLYYVHYPKELPYAWQYGFDQIANYVDKNGRRYDKIIISDRYDQPYILMAFFLQYPPDKLQQELVMTPRDKFGFSTVRNFSNMEFRAINFEEDKKLSNTLIISADESVDDEVVIDTIPDLLGRPMYKIIETNSLPGVDAQTNTANYEK